MKSNTKVNVFELSAARFSGDFLRNLEQPIETYRDDIQTIFGLGFVYDETSHTYSCSGTVQSLAHFADHFASYLESLNKKIRKQLAKQEKAFAKARRQEEEASLLSSNEVTQVKDEKSTITTVEHDPEELVSVDIECPCCSFTTLSLVTYKQHMQTHQNVKVFNFHCRKCDYRTQTKAKFIRHMGSVHVIAKKHLCDECGVSFKRKDHLRIHQAAKHGTLNKSHHCHLCPKSFRCKDHLLDHQVVHSKEKNFLCEICGSSYKTERTRAQHIHYKHTNPREFCCPACQKRFNTKQALQRHRCPSQKEQALVMGPQVLPREMDGETRAISQQLALQIKAEMYRYQEKECGVVPTNLDTARNARSDMDTQSVISQSCVDETTASSVPQFTSESTPQTSMEPSRCQSPAYTEPYQRKDFTPSHSAADLINVTMLDFHGDDSVGGYNPVNHTPSESGMSLQPEDAPCYYAGCSQSQGTEPLGSQPMRVEPMTTESLGADSSVGEPTRTEPIRVGPLRAESLKAESLRAESLRAGSLRAESVPDEVGYQETLGYMETQPPTRPSSRCSSIQSASQTATQYYPEFPRRGSIASTSGSQVTGGDAGRAEAFTHLASNTGIMEYYMQSIQQNQANESEEPPPYDSFIRRSASTASLASLPPHVSQVSDCGESASEAGYPAQYSGELPAFSEPPYHSAAPSVAPSSVSVDSRVPSSQYSEVPMELTEQYNHSEAVMSQAESIPQYSHSEAVMSQAKSLLLYSHTGPVISPTETVLQNSHARSVTSQADPTPQYSHSESVVSQTGPAPHYSHIGSITAQSDPTPHYSHSQLIVSQAGPCYEEWSDTQSCFTAPSTSSQIYRPSTSEANQPVTTQPYEPMDYHPPKETVSEQETEEALRTTDRHSSAFKSPPRRTNEYSMQLSEHDELHTPTTEQPPFSPFSPLSTETSVTTSFSKENAVTESASEKPELIIPE